MASSAAADAGTSVDLDGEEQEEPLSSLVFEVAEALDESLDKDKDDSLSKQLFRAGVVLERQGKLYEPIQHYKRVKQILPTRLYESAEPRDIPQVESETEEGAFGVVQFPEVLESFRVLLGGGKKK